MASSVPSRQEKLAQRYALSQITEAFGADVTALQQEVTEHKRALQEVRELASERTESKVTWRVLNLDTRVGHLVRGTVEGMPLSSLRTVCGWWCGNSRQ
eukprot:4019676-Amphidinium_carterae.1